MLTTFCPLAAMLLRSRPEDIGLTPDGGRPPVTDSDGSDSATKGSTTRAGAPSPKVSGWTLHEASRTGALWIIVAAK